MEKIEDAETYAHRAKQLQDKRLLPHDPERVELLRTLAQICVAKRAFREAGTYLHEALSIGKRSLGSTSEYWTDIDTTAEVMLLDGRQEQAEIQLHKRSNFSTRCQCRSIRILPLL